MKTIFRISLVVIGVLVMISCNKEYEDITTEKGFKGVFVRNEGGTISFYHETDSVVTPDVYKNINNSDLGAEAMAFSIIGNKGYILTGMANSQSIELVNSNTFALESSKDGFSNITDLKAVSDEFICVTQGVSGDENSGSLMFLDGLTLSPLSAPAMSSVKVGKNPTRVVYNRGKKLYVANTGGGTYVDSTVMVVDITTSEVIDTIALEQRVDATSTLKLKTPVEMVIDAYQNVWVLCTGVNNEFAGLAKIEYGTHVVKVFQFETYDGNGRNNLTVSAGGGVIYYINGGMCKMGINDKSLPTTKFFEENDTYKNMEFDAIGVSSNTGGFYLAKDGVGGANGSVYLLDNNAIISSMTKFDVGVKPRQFIFVR